MGRKPREKMNLQGQEGELRFTLQIKRAATGETEIVELVGKISDEVEILEDLQEEKSLQHTD